MAGIKPNKLETAVIAGTVAMIGVQYSPLNEVILSGSGGAVLDRTHNALATGGATAATVVAIDGTISMGTAFLLSRFRPSVNLAYERYGKDHGQTDEQKMNSTKKAQRAIGMAGMAFLTGGAGVVTYYDYKAGGNTLKQNVKNGAAATGLLALTVGTIGNVVGGAATAAEAKGYNGASQVIVDSLKFVIPGLFLGGFGLAAVRKRRALHKKVSAELTEEAVALKA